MALVIDDWVKETSATTGTGAYTLAGAVTGFQSFAAVGNGNTTWYSATNGTDWEVGIGTYTSAGTTLARTTIISSSNADAAVSWAAGTKTLTCSLPASKAFIGPASAADNAIVRYDGTGGETVQDSLVFIQDTTGRLSVGSEVSADFSGNTIIPNVQTLGTTTNTGSIGASRFSADVNPPRFLLGKSRGATIDDYTVVASGDSLGEVNFQGADGTDFAPGAIISAVVDGTPGAGDMPTRLMFSTSADASEAPTERLRITSAGRMIHTLGQVAHFWVYWTGASTTILASHNVSSIDNDATGDAGINLTTAFSSANYSAFVCTNETGTDGWDADSIQSSGINVHTAGVVDVLCGVMIDGTTAVGNTTNPDQWQAVGFGVSA